MFTFSVTAVRAVLMRGRIDAFLNAGFRNPHYELAPGKDEKPGLWLVGDEGVYILSNGKLAEAVDAEAEVAVRPARAEVRAVAQQPGRAAVGRGELVDHRRRREDPPVVALEIKHGGVALEAPAEAVAPSDLRPAPA